MRSHGLANHKLLWENNYAPTTVLCKHPIVICCDDEDFFELITDE